MDGVIVIVGWCNGDGIYDYPYRGPGHTCPFADAVDGVPHGMVKRRAWVCCKCGMAHLIQRQYAPPEHYCDPDGTPFNPCPINENGRGCQWPDCHHPHKAKGYCSNHYGQLLKKGAFTKGE